MFKRSDFVLFFLIFALSIFGIVITVSANMGNPDYFSQNYLLYGYLRKSLIVLLIGFVAMVISFALFNYKILNLIYHPIVLVLMFTFLLLPLGFEAVGGAKAWINLGFFKLQPSEFAKTYIILYLAQTLNVKYSTKKITSKDIIKTPIIIVASMTFIIMILQHDFGSAAIFFGIAFVSLLVSNQNKTVRLQNYLTLIMILLFFVILIVFLTPFLTDFLISLDTDNYMIKRFIMASDPFLDPYDKGFQLINGLVSMASGGLSGAGIGNSVRKYMNFFATSTDFVSSIIVEELGFIGFSVFFLSYCTVILKLILHAFRDRNSTGSAILFGTATYFFIHLLLNVGGASSLVPLTGVPLLLISEGGSAKLSAYILIGICLKVIYLDKRRKT